ncbi:MAG TPA: hypothetical protein DEP35_12860 [Deltaproteobacteria bacterium]|nr:hypothetical protein [Deltaproteobacteria bacterium]
MVPRRALEDRIFSAIQEWILVPEVVALAVENAADLVCAGLSAPPEPLGPSERLKEINVELATIRRVAARSGRRQELSRGPAELEAERAHLSRSPSGGAGPALAPEVLRAAIEARVREVRSAFEVSLQDRREAFRALLGNRRMRLGPDRERGFRVEGVFSLDLESA